MITNVTDDGIKKISYVKDTVTLLTNSHTVYTIISIITAQPMLKMLINQ